MKLATAIVGWQACGCTKRYEVEYRSPGALRDVGPCETAAHLALVVAALDSASHYLRLGKIDQARWELARGGAIRGAASHEFVEELRHLRDWKEIQESCATPQDILSALIPILEGVAAELTQQATGERGSRAALVEAANTLDAAARRAYVGGMPESVQPDNRLSAPLAALRGEVA
jgi:hypothetical protein